MFGPGKGIAGRGCIFVSATHVLVDIAKELPPLSHADALHRLEPAMLCAATLALLLHLALERALFDRIIAAAHSCNLTIGWIGASGEWLWVVRTVHELSWFRATAALALLIAAIATVVELFGLRCRRRRMSFLAAMVALALCMQPRDCQESASMPSHSRSERREPGLCFD